jgi:hypothetical protein
LCCLYGRFESANIILKKYGSNQININKTDFKGRTCMDLAWSWLMNCIASINEDIIKNEQENQILYDLNEPFYSSKNLAFFENKLENEFQLINLLVQYGAKFSNCNQLMYNFEPIKKVIYFSFNKKKFIFYYYFVFQFIESKQTSK